MSGSRSDALEGMTEISGDEGYTILARLRELLIREGHDTKSLEGWCGNQLHTNSTHRNLFSYNQQHDSFVSLDRNIEVYVSTTTPLTMAFKVRSTSRQACIVPFKTWRTVGPWEDGIRPSQLGITGMADINTLLDLVNRFRMGVPQIDPTLRAYTSQVYRGYVGWTETPWYMDVIGKEVGAARFVVYTPERFVTRVLGITKQETIRKVSIQIANELALYSSEGWELELLKGPAIRDAYRNEVGGRSCMTGDCSKFTAIYAANPDKVQLAVLRPKGITTPHEAKRCLVWKSERGIMMHDRIYPSCNGGAGAQMMRMKLSEKFPGIIDTIKAINAEDTQFAEVVRLKMATNDYMPYMDSFRHGKRHTPSNEVVVMAFNNESHFTKYLEEAGIGATGFESRMRDFGSTEGGPYSNGDDEEDDDSWTCECCTESTTSESYSVGYRGHTTVCQDCYENLYHEVLNYQYCIEDDDCVWSENLGGYLWTAGDMSAYTFVDSEDDYYSVEDVIQDVNDTKQVKDNCVEVLDEKGKAFGWMLKDDAFYHADSDTYFVSEEDALEAHPKEEAADA